MPVTVVLEDVIHGPGEKVRVKFAGGFEIEFPSISEAREWSLTLDSDEDLAKQMAVAYAFKRSDDLSNVNSIAGKDFIVDFSHASIVRVR